VLRRLLAWFSFALGSRGRRIALFVLIAVGAVGVAGAVLVPDFRIVIDPAAIVFGVAACILAWTLYTLAARRRTSARSVAVTYELKLQQPTFRGGRYRFELEIWYELDLASGRERARQARIELVFKRGDHPDLWSWANTQVDEYLRAHRRIASRRFPGADVVALPSPHKRALRARRPEILLPELESGPEHSDDDRPESDHDAIAAP